MKKMSNSIIFRTCVFAGCLFLAKPCLAPLVSCIYCGDVTGDLGLTARDFLTVLGEYGQSSSGQNPGGQSLQCLDFEFSLDDYIDLYDLLGWDWGEYQISEGLTSNLCFDICLTPCDSPATSSLTFETPTATPRASESNGFAGSLLISGKRFDAVSEDFLSDRLYDCNENYNLVGGPYALPNDRMNGRLVRDHNDQLYQINVEDGLVRLSDFSSVIPRGHGYSIGREPRYGQAADVYIGLQDVGEDTWGRPISDVEFDAAGYVYVTPVIVDPNIGAPYAASAKLELSQNDVPPYHVLEIYDDPPLPNSNQDCNNLHEIEVDDHGSVYVINSGYTNNSDVLWVFNDDGDVNKYALQSLDIYGPVGLCCSSYDNSRLYVASTMSEPNADSASLYILSTVDLALVQTVNINNMGHITDITEDPNTGTVWVAGFTMPLYITYLPADLSQMTQFYQPYLAAVAYGNSGPVQATHLTNAADLALPLSIEWIGPIPKKCDRANLDGMGDVSLGDLAILVAQWLQAPGIPSADIAPASGGDGMVNFFDLAILAGHWMENCGP